MFESTREVPDYLVLLNANGKECQAAVERIHDAVGAAGAADSLRAFLDDPNWRPHLVAAVAILLSDDPASYAGQLWSAVDRGSWVAPQLVATLAMVDPGFVEAAKRRVRSGCPVSPPTELDPIERHVATGPADAPMRIAKNLAALVSALDGIPSARTWIEEQRRDVETQRLLAADIDHSALIVEHWAAAIRAHFQVLGRNLPSPAA